MKKTDIAAVILISVITTIVAYFIGNALLGDPNEEKTTITYMDVVKPDISQPDPEVFNPTAVNPTVEVFVGNCPDGQMWDVANQVCIAPQEEEEDNSETDPNNSETGE